MLERTHGLVSSAKPGIRSGGQPGWLATPERTKASGSVARRREVHDGHDGLVAAAARSTGSVLLLRACSISGRQAGREAACVGDAARSRGGHGALPHKEHSHPAGPRPRVPAVAATRSAHGGSRRRCNSTHENWKMLLARICAQRPRLVGPPPLIQCRNSPGATPATAATSSSLKPAALRANRAATLRPLVWRGRTPRT